MLQAYPDFWKGKIKGKKLRKLTWINDGTFADSLMKNKSKKIRGRVCAFWIQTAATADVTKWPDLVLAWCYEWPDHFDWETQHLSSLLSIDRNWWHPSSYQEKIFAPLRHCKTLNQMWNPQYLLGFLPRIWQHAKKWHWKRQDPYLEWWMGCCHGECFTRPHEG